MTAYKSQHACQFVQECCLSGSKAIAVKGWLCARAPGPVRLLQGKVAGVFPLMHRIASAVPLSPCSAVEFNSLQTACCEISAEHGARWQAQHGAKHSISTCQALSSPLAPQNRWRLQ